MPEKTKKRAVYPELDLTPADQRLEFGLVDESVRCPSCQEEYGLHIVGVRVNAGGKITCITSIGTKEMNGDVEGRGVSVAIDYACELCGDVTRFVQRFQKGQVLAYLQLLRASKGDSLEDDWGGRPDIWRD